MRNNQTTNESPFQEELTADEIDQMSEKELRAHLTRLGHCPDQQLAIFKKALESMKQRAALESARRDGRKLH